MVDRGRSSLARDLYLPAQSIALKGKLKVADQNVTTLPNRRLEALERRIAENIIDAVLTVEQFNIHEQPESAERLDEIAFLAAKLSNELNDLCRSEHYRSRGVVQREDLSDAAPAAVDSRKP